MQKIFLLSAVIFLVSGCVEERVVVRRGAIYDPYPYYDIGPTFYTPVPVIIKKPYHHDHGLHRGHYKHKRHPHRHY